MRAALCKFILNHLLKWKVVGNFPKDIKKYILIGAPHTSNMDFIIGILLKYSEKVPISFVGKKSLFKFPFGYFFKALGGVPVNRAKKEKTVNAITRIFEERNEFIMAISPEGTRSKVTEWKTGFYHIARLAQVPIVALTFDFGKHQTEIFPPFYPTGDMQKDFEYLKLIYRNVKGKVAKNSFD